MYSLKFFQGWKFSQISLVSTRPQKLSPVNFFHRCRVWLEAWPQNFVHEKLFLSRIWSNVKCLHVSLKHILGHTILLTCTLTVHAHDMYRSKPPARQTSTSKSTQCVSRVWSGPSQTTTGSPQPRTLITTPSPSGRLADPYWPSSPSSRTKST